MTDTTLTAHASAAERTLAFLHEHRDALRATAEESEQLRRLSPAAARILQEAGTPRMRLPEHLGGLGLNLPDQMRLLRELAEIDPASAWSTMVTSNATAILGLSLSDETFTKLFVDAPAPVVAGVAGPGGTARRVDGGYVVQGTWRFCSGIHLADWVICNPTLDGDAAQPIGIAVPKSDVQVHDSWNVIGLRGTGSADFTLAEVFVPDAHLMSREPLRTWENVEPPSADLGEHIVIAIGIARLALGALRDGYLAGTYKWREREVVQSEFSRLTIALDAAERTAFQMFEEINDSDAQLLPKEFWLRLGALATYATDLAVDCAEFALKRGGGRGLYMPNPLERALRDAMTARAHVLVSDQNYASHGASLLGLVSDRQGHR